jgi:hypothetical protein
MASRHGQLVQATIYYLTVLGYETWPVPNRGVKVKDRRTGEGRWIRGIVKPGVADVSALSPHGRFVACEIKVRDKRGRMDTLSNEQLRFKAAVEQRSGLFYEVKETVDALIQAYKRGEI